MGISFPSPSRNYPVSSSTTTTPTAKSDTKKTEVKPETQATQPDKNQSDNTSSVKTEVCATAAMCTTSPQTTFQTPERALNTASGLVKEAKEKVQDLRTKADNLLGTLSTQAEQGVAKLASVADSIQLPPSVEAKLDDASAKLSKTASDIGEQAKGSLGKVVDTAIGALNGINDSV